MNKRIVKPLLATVVVAGFMLGNVQTASAASQDECAIWLCAPSGFPSGCGAAKSAMKKRVKKGKSPLPPYSSCAVDDDSMSSKHGPAAFYPAHNKCVDWYLNDEPPSCNKSVFVPAHHKKNTHCPARGEHDYSPGDCTRTDNYLDIFINGHQEGKTYFW